MQWGKRVFFMNFVEKYFPPVWLIDCEWELDIRIRVEADVVSEIALIWSMQ